MPEQLCMLIFRHYDKPIIMIATESVILDKLNSQDLAELKFIESPTGGEAATMIGPGAYRIDLESFPEGTAMLFKYKLLVPEPEEVVTRYNFRIKG